ncbi:hypothetical protein SAMN02745912_00869 [Paramaledivibacter caminithermalis DSM 15212]|uniref:Uncharacterized protein n=2 Tax=Paramaledivibacter TaxID=1884934 RepID=A0A1M6LNV2_PARC5|nr:hypothetical protein SAMN02745912_00869 [Paramaledivibacter caminithermalis DSM 15212]
MRNKFLTLVLLVGIFFIMSSSVNAIGGDMENIPSFTCPRCGSSSYHQVIETRNYGFTRFLPRQHDGPYHLDAEYHLWQSKHYKCDDCLYESQRVFFERDIILCPGEPIPYLVNVGNDPQKHPH